MALVLKTVQARQGGRWIGDAFRLFARRPLAFTLLSLALFGMASLLRLLPLMGAVLPLAAMPLLSLGFMVAAQSALLDGPVHPRQFIEPLLTDAKRRRSMLILCISYAAAMVLVWLLSDSMSDHAWNRVTTLDPRNPEVTPEMEALLVQLWRGTLTLTVLGGLVSVPFWHAPALVHWGGQGAKQALFSSTLALWRTRGAFFVYMLGWTGLALMMSFVVGVMAVALGMQQAQVLVLLPSLLVLTAVFYISVLFTFNDTFGGAAGVLPAEEPQPPA